MKREGGGRKSYHIPIFFAALFSHAPHIFSASMQPLGSGGELLATASRSLAPAYRRPDISVSASSDRRYPRNGVSSFLAVCADAIARASSLARSLASQRALYFT